MTPHTNKTMKKEPKIKELTVAGKTAEQIKAEAQAALLAEKKGREESFLKEYEALKAKYNVELIPVITIYPNKAPIGGLKAVSL